MKKLALLVAVAAAFAVTPQALAATVQVSITRAGFVPGTVEVIVGDTVTWTNADTRDRQVVSQAAGFASPVLKPADRFSFTFTTAGRFSYEDPLVRPRQRGTVNVLAPGGVSISARPPAVTYGAATTLSGRVSSRQSGERVTVFGQACGGAFVRLGEVTTTNGGAWSFQAKPLDTTGYRVQWRNATSTTLTVNVRPRIRLVKLAPRKFRVRVFAAQSFAGRTVVFQRWNATRRVWVRVRYVTLVGTQLGVSPTIVSGRTFRSRIRTGLRVRVAMGPLVAGRCYVPSRSNVIFS